MLMMMLRTRAHAAGTVITSAAAARTRTGFCTFPSGPATRSIPVAPAHPYNYQLPRRPRCFPVPLRTFASSAHPHATPSPTHPPTYNATMTEFYNLKAELPSGKAYDFEQLKGKVVLIVNVASKWCVSAVECFLQHKTYRLRTVDSHPNTRASRRSTTSTSRGTLSSSDSHPTRYVTPSKRFSGRSAAH